MGDKAKISYYLSWSLKLILLGLFIFSTFYRQFPINIAVLVAVFLSFSPAFVERSYKYHFPIELDAVVTFAILLDSMGRVFNFYGQFDWFDQITHFMGTATISLTAFYIMFSFLYLKKIKLPPWAIALFTFCIAMTIGALWEIGEWQFDRLTGGTYNTYRDEPNSIRDMKWDVIGGIVVAILGNFYIKGRLDGKKKKSA